MSKAIAEHRRVPGLEGFWVFIAGDMTLFALLFGAFMAERRDTPTLFEHGRQALNPNIGGLNTLVLLTSSWLVVNCLIAVRRGQARAGLNWLTGAIACGVAFLCSKVLEYSRELGDGHSVFSSDFFMFYFILTGIHLFHVVVGCVVMSFFWAKIRNKSISGRNGLAGLECMGIYWHMVDLLWIMLFPLLYLLR